MGLLPNYDQFNQCEHLINHFSALTILESALIWCGVAKEHIPNFIKDCRPKGDSGVASTIYQHPYISCVEPRCRVLNEAFENNLLKMGRDGGKGHYIKDIGHIAYPRRTIMINDLKEYIQEHHPNDMPKTLFSSVEINKVQPISHENYLSLTAKLDALTVENERLQQSLMRAEQNNKEQKAKDERIAELERQLNERSTPADMELTGTSKKAVTKLLYALLLEHNYSIDGTTKGATNNTLENLTTRYNVPITREIIAKWLNEINTLHHDKNK